MIIALKILLFALLVACGLTAGFLYKEFKGVVKSTEFDESSIWERFIIYLMAFGSGILMLSIMAFAGFLLFCEISINYPILPW